MQAAITAETGESTEAEKNGPVAGGDLRKNSTGHVTEASGNGSAAIDQREMF